MNIFTKLFKKVIPDIIEPKSILPEKNLNDISQFDDVWVKINGTICEGWVLQRIDNIVEIVYTNPNSKLVETSFKIERPLNRDFLEQENKILYLTKKAAGIQ